MTTSELRAFPSPGGGKLIRKLPGPWSYVAAVVVLFFAAVLLDAALTNKNFGWPIVAEYMFNPSIIKGLFLSLGLMVLVMVIGSVLGLILAVMRLSSNRILSSASALYVWFFRGTPLLIQVIFWFNIAALFPTIGLEIPFGPLLFGMDANKLITPFTAALLALSLNEAALMAEVIRGGLLGVNRGQSEAARALGMKPAQVYRIIIPQAVRMIIPPTGNNLVGAFKNTSLVSIIGLSDLLHSAQIIYALNYQTIPLLIVVGLWYLFVTSVLGYIQHLLEAHYSKGFVPRKVRQGAPAAAQEQEVAA
ncbi:amino acid ABC transporter permease [Microbacterium pseudoresistens]|uniref:Polar amino acid transport system permease protein n=1 Tax=Microbacterium pseudoresistens TaxID=640634 RepID=A0A7Y9JLU3_9MICO|nr:amino acid ABC transporter permease [Microbacterium pseudoresistens]NYD53695.1 polar amino acid transport system permease protein [Microbacterium pseudoresistens]